LAWLLVDCGEEWPLIIEDKPGELGILPSKRASPTPTLPHFASTKITELEARVERIEKRLDLVDPAVPEQP